MSVHVADGIDEINDFLLVPTSWIEQEPSRHRRSVEEEQIKERLKLAQNLLQQKSLVAALDPPFVASRAELKDLIRENPKNRENSHRVLQGWRREFVGNDLLELLAKPM